jgi:hypothetical protein
MSAVAQQMGRLPVELESDGPLYHAAVTFVQDHRSVDPAQFSALLQHAQRWSDLRAYVAKQVTRDWQGNKEYYKAYFGDLKSELDRVERRAREFVDPGLTSAEKRAHTTLLAGLLGREYIQHLWAEATMRSGGDR